MAGFEIWFDSEIWLDWAGDLGEFVEWVVLQFWLEWVGHLVWSKIWLGRRFVWMGCWDGFYIWLGQRFSCIGMEIWLG